MPSKYSEDFVKRVKAMYPESINLHEFLDEGKDRLVGRCLEDLKDLPIDQMGPKNIIKAFKEGREKDVLEAAEEYVRREALYTEWLQMIS